MKDLNKQKTLVIIDVQMDYFQGGKFPLENSDKVLKKIINFIKDNDLNLIIVEHMNEDGIFTKGSDGQKTHPKLMEALKSHNYKIITKKYANAFIQTELDKELRKSGVKEFYIAGMMTQNCITHTFFNKDNYNKIVIKDLCAAPTQIIHNIAIRAFNPLYKTMLSKEVK